jgi:regulator of nonsense transcripts 2
LLGKKEKVKQTLFYKNIQVLKSQTFSLLSVETPKSLDSNIKKNTAFIKKCKTSMAADLKVQLLNDIKKLSLEKYISEIVGGVMEGMLKCKTSTDINACVEVSPNLFFPFLYK